MRTTRAAAASGVAALVLLTGCGTSAAGPARSSSPTSAPSLTSGAGPDPVEACVRQVTYWVGETLRAAPDQGFDYQHMGLSGATYEVVRALVDEARAGGGSDAATTALVATRAEEECRALEGSTPTGGADPGGWP